MTTVVTGRPDLSATALAAKCAQFAAPPDDRSRGRALSVLRSACCGTRPPITSVYLRGIDKTEIAHAVHERPAPMIPAAHGL